MKYKGFTIHFLTIFLYDELFSISIFAIHINDKFIDNRILISKLTKGYFLNIVIFGFSKDIYI